MAKIPKHCIKKFKEHYTSYPSILSIPDLNINDDINKFFSKSRIVWREEHIDSDGVINTTHKLVDYDSSGVMVFISKSPTIYNTGNVYILTTEARMDVAKLTISRLNKIKNGNNSGTTKREN